AIHRLPSTSRGVTDPPLSIAPADRLVPKSIPNAHRVLTTPPPIDGKYRVRPAATPRRGAGRAGLFAPARRGERSAEDERLVEHRLALDTVEHLVAPGHEAAGVGDAVPRHPGCLSRPSCVEDAGLLVEHSVEVEGDVVGGP